MDRRTLLGISGIGATILLLSACDTGDGKQLRDVDPADITASTAPAESSTTTLDSLPSLSGGSPSQISDPDRSSSTFAIEAPWRDGAAISDRYTCEGLDISPEVSWSSPPGGTLEFAVALVDDSTVSDGRSFVQWAVAGIDPSATELAEGELPTEAVEAINYFGDEGYGGPCPDPADGPHDYRLTIYALNQPLQLADRTPATEFLDVIEDNTIGSAELIGTFER